MESIYFKNTRELRANFKELEEKLKVKIIMTGKRADIEGSGFDEYEAKNILEAINFGFSAKKALLLKDENFSFSILHIKNISRRKNLKEVRGRVIGREGKTKRTIENISDCHLVIKNNEVGIIGDAESLEEAKTALQSLIRGSKESNVYKFLEKM